MAEFTKLFEPGKMGKVELKNRIIMAPCGTHYSTHYGHRNRPAAGLLRRTRQRRRRPDYYRGRQYPQTPARQAGPDPG